MKQFFFNLTGIPIYLLGFVPFSGPIYYPLQSWHDRTFHERPCRAISCGLCGK